MRRLAVLVTALVGTGLSGVAGASDAPSSDAAVSFKRDIVPLLRRTCATCHITGTEPGNMALHPGAAYRTLVGVPSVQTDLLRVKPGAPAESYLLLKLEGTHLDAGGTGQRMPFGLAPLDASQIDKIRAWIAAGAADN